MRILRECNCGDPRFPVPDGMQHCKAADPVASIFLIILDFNLRKMFGRINV